MQVALPRDQLRPKPDGAEPIPIFVRTPVEAMDLRRFWTAQFHRWNARPGNHFRMLDGTRRSKLDVVVAILGLLDNMRHDGALRGPRGFWSLDQLAGFMKMSHNVAASTLKTLEQMGALVVIPAHDKYGHHLTSERRLRIPGQVEPKVQTASSEVHLGQGSDLSAEVNLGNRETQKSLLRRAKSQF
jgi:hypothetical protein